MKSTEDRVGETLKSEKDQYVEKRKSQIDNWHTEIEELDAKITAADVDAKAKLEHKAQVAELRQKRDEARAKLTEIEEAEDNRWEDLKDGLENVWTNIKYGFEKVKAKF